MTKKVLGFLAFGLAGGVLAIEKIGGTCLRGFGWLIVGSGAAMQRLTRIAESRART